MPVEIRELVIKTHIVSRLDANAAVPRAEDLQQLKQQIVQECLKALKNAAPKSEFDR
jgi:Family of unknown function (DUF5908)